LGGWLILERWMTPSLFAGTSAEDEYTFMQTDGAAEKVRRHRETFITEADFVWLKRHNIEAVRIPVGYWLLNGDKPYSGGIEYLDWAVAMSEKYSLKVVIDLHGLPGSQNGYDHSGRAGKAEWFDDESYRAGSLDIIARFAERYKAHASLWGIQIINEPRLSVSRVGKVLSFYHRAYRSLTTILPAHVHIIVSDGFIPRILSWVLPRSMSRLMLDVHLYHMTTPLAQYRSLRWFFKKTQRRASFIRRLQKRHPVIIGEWSSVLRHTTTQKMKKNEEATAVRKYVALQRTAYDSAHAWFYWNYKTEHPGVWSYRTIAET
jgi:glucan 1,3-beta-glucosidase